ncbi:hypothetical protein K505DRAFT_330594 [Melanomma pulvis-pyrius CBS 109.77]|uniref:Uncharacterized protein n=1 Tax=Melanomma pulvis-pyrius CBS 109.77 TaxID=1314802 RepID=A0A6A6WQ85_9PLEO|nr:hypothetical protein K505DRAFT_330594 [Melanomma pulvis-pyrius CBS 109.77]
MTGLVVSPRLVSHSGSLTCVFHRLQDELHRTGRAALVHYHHPGICPHINQFLIFIPGNSLPSSLRHSTAQHTFRVLNRETAAQGIRRLPPHIPASTQTLTAFTNSVRALPMNCLLPLQIYNTVMLRYDTVTDNKTWLLVVVHTIAERKATVSSC